MKILISPNRSCEICSIEIINIMTYNSSLFKGMGRYRQNVQDCEVRYKISGSNKI